MDFSADPFSILTIIKGSENYSQESLQQEGPIHKALETLATWNEIWPSGQPPALQEKSFSTVKKKVANHSFYANKNGRVVWFPQLFAARPNGAAAQHSTSSAATIAIC